MGLRATLLFFCNDTATTEIYTLSLHDALPTSCGAALRLAPHRGRCTPTCPACGPHSSRSVRDRKSTRLNSSHANISYAVFCLKKKKKKKNEGICNKKKKKKKIK